MTASLSTEIRAADEGAPSRWRRKRTALSLAGAIVAVTLLAGCASTTSASSSATTPTSTSTAKACSFPSGAPHAPGSRPSGFPTGAPGAGGGAGGAGGHNFKGGSFPGRGKGGCKPAS